MKTLEDLRTFAAERHGDQRYGDLPYVVHLDDVEARARHHGLSEVYRRAAYGHDLLDDTNTSMGDLLATFGTAESALILSVSGVGKTRAERRADTLRRLTEFPRGIDLKGVDRLSNLSQAIADRNLKLVKMYLGEESAYAPFFAKATPSIQAELADLYAEGKRLLERG